MILSILLGCLVPTIALAQGLWKPDRFVVGTWMDPTNDAINPRITSQSMAVARAGHFNLLTGMHHHFSGWRVTTPPDTSKLTSASAAGLQVALTHNDFYGTAATPPANVPAYDSTLAPYVFMPLRSGSLSARAKNAATGFCLWDEPAYDTTGAANVSTFLRNWTGALHREDLARGDGRARMAWINFYNGCGGGYACYETYLRKYLSDPDPLKRPDVASITLFPFTGTTQTPVLHNYFYWMRVMRDVMIDRHFWVISMASEVAAGNIFARPDENHLRFMALAPAAAGATGIIWFTYQSDDGYGFPLTGHTNDTESIVREDVLPTCKYRMLEPINHYLEHVVGPVVLNSRHLGLFHQSTQPPYGDPYRPQDFVTSTLSEVTQNCPVSSFESNGGTLDGTVFAVGVFAPNDGSTDRYLLVLNKSLVAKRTVVRLRDVWDIAQSPSVVGYEGGTNWTPLPEGNSFPVSLAGGEGRFFRLRRAPFPTLTLLTPLSNEVWAPFETRTISWMGDGAPVDLRLYSSANGDSSEIDGPLVLQRLGISESSDTLTMPPILSRHARIVLTSRGFDGIVRNATHDFPIRTAISTAPAGTSLALGSGNCTMQADLALGPDGTPWLAYRDAVGHRVLAHMQAGAWQVSEIPDPIYPTANLSGVNPRIAVDPSSLPHVLFTRPYLNDLVEHSRDAAGVWHSWTLDQPHRLRDDAPVVAATDGSLYAAYDGGSAGLVVKRGTGGMWTVFGTAIPAVRPRSVTLRLTTDGRPWVACIDRDPGDPLEAIRTFEWTGSAWKERSFTGHFDHLELALDPANKACVVYTERMKPGVHQLWLRWVWSTAWPAAQPVTASLANVQGLSIAYLNGSPVIAFAADGVLQVARKNGALWSLEALEDATEADAPVRLAFGPGGERWIAFHDRSLDVLRVLGPSTGVSGVGCPGCPAPRTTELEVFAPNPLHPNEAIAFELRLGGPRTFDAALFDLAGRRVAARDFGIVAAGEHRVEWRPAALNPGAYFLRCRIGGVASPARRLVLLR